VAAHAAANVEYGFSLPKPGGRGQTVDQAAFGGN
jgi:hypothetical protein